MLIARVEYEGLLHRLAIRASAASRAVDPSLPEEARNRGPAVGAGAEERGSAGSAAAESGAAVRAASASSATFRGSRGNRWQLVESRYGLVDPDTADFLEAEGFGVGSVPMDGGVAADAGGVAADEIGRRR